MSVNNNQNQIIRTNATTGGSPGFEHMGMYKFNPVFTSKLDTFSSDILDYLYEIEPQSQNLFWAGFFCETGNGDNGLRIFYNACYRIRSIQIPMPGLEFEHQKDYRIPVFKNINYSQEVTIDWFDDVYHSVLMYHTNWVERWYNRYFDVLRTGRKGKFRKLFVVPFHYINSPTDFNSPIEVPVVEPLMAFEIGGLVPKTIPPLKFDYGTDGNDQSLSITYNCAKVYWGHNIELINSTLPPSHFSTETQEKPSIQNEKAEEDDDELTVDDKYAAWNITNITPDIGIDQENADEKFRIQRTIYSLIPGTGGLA